MRRCRVKAAEWVMVRRVFPGIVALVLAAVPVGLSAAPTAAIPAAIAARWQPLRPLDGAPAYKRRELRAAVRSSSKKRWARACKAAEKLRAGLMKKAAAIFYARARTDADLAAIKAFMKRYVQRRDPLLSVAQEVFAPAPALRNLAVDACVRAGKPAIARRFLDQAAASSGDGHLRTAAAVVRLAAGVDKARLGWLIDKRNVGARAWLVRAYGAPARVRDKHLAKARAVADFSEREDIDAVATWMRGGKR